MSVRCAIWVAVVCAARIAHADVRVDEVPAEAPPAARSIALAIDGCLDSVRTEIERAVQLEVPRADARIAVTCAGGDSERGAIIEIQPAQSARRYRYALDWQAQPRDARPRLLGLAVAEALAASRIELVAVPEPPPPNIAPHPAAPSRWTVGALGGGHWFAGEHGVAALGGGVTIGRRWSSRVRLAADLFAEGSTEPTGSGVITVVAMSAAPRLAYRVGGRAYAEAGLGARVGIVAMRGETSGTGVRGSRFLRPWLGPIATLAVGAAISHALAVAVRLELGEAVVGSTARDFTVPSAAFDGRWSSVVLGVELAL